MSSLTAVRPEEVEYAQSYAKYIKLVPDGDILLTLARQMDESLTLLSGIGEAQAAGRYAPGKWSIKEVVGHVTDAERIFSYRALRFARNDQTPLPRFEKDDYVIYGNFDEQRLSDLAEGFRLVRNATTHFFSHLSEESWLRGGIANDKKATVRALAYLIAGHEAHHMQLIRLRYL